MATNERKARARMLRKVRDELGLTPTETARALGVDYHTYASWQSGRRRMPDIGVRCVELLQLIPKRELRRLSKRED